MNDRDLDTLHDEIAQQADLVEAMAAEEEEGLVRLEESFVHETFLEVVAAKRARMREWEELRLRARPLTQAWIESRAAGRELHHAGVEDCLARLQEAFVHLNLVEERLERMASSYLRSLAASGGSASAEDRIHLHRAWGG